MMAVKDETVKIPKSEYGKLLEPARLVEVIVAENARLVAENKLLRDKVDLLVRRVFGSSSEKLDINQMTLDIGADFERALNEDGDGPEPPPRPRKKRTLKKDRLPDDLPEERITVIPEEVRADPGAYDCIGSEETVKLDVTPMSFRKVVTVRPKFIRRESGQAPVIAPAPRQLISGSFASESLLTRIIVDKYADHQPLYRQEQIFARLGITLSRKTMADWVWRIGDWLRTIYDELGDTLRRETYLQVDETPVRYLAPGNGKTKKGYLWVCLAPGKGVYLEWHPGRGAECLEGMLNGFRGIVQNDGYPAYWSYNNKRLRELGLEKLEIGCCWAHARRKFHEAKAESALARDMLKEIRQLYLVEASLRDAGSSVGQRAAARRETSKPVLDRMKKRLEQERGWHLPQSLTGKAISYTLNLWNELNVFVEHGEIEIDNNLVENLIRVPALGKKNWMFFGSKDAGVTNAIIMTVLLNCKMHGINPEEYLKDVLARLPHITNHQARELTPAKWLSARQAKTLTA